MYPGNYGKVLSFQDNFYVEYSTQKSHKYVIKTDLHPYAGLQSCSAAPM